MILVIDNYDSFVHNIVRYFKCAGEACTVVRNDKITVEEAEKIDPLAIVISPGPCTPKEAGVSVELIKKLGAFIPVFGICLGHQCIGEAFGAKTVRTAPVHGQASAITNDGSGIFAGLPGTLNAGRYHSLITELSAMSPLRVTARTEDGIIMAMQHTAQPVYGVQFHPESILTDRGADMIENFTAIARRWREVRKIAA